MKKKKTRNLVQKKIDKHLILSSIIKYKVLFDNVETYEKLKLYLFNLLPTLETRYKEDDLKLFQWSIIFDVNSHVFKFISEEIKNGNIDLEIKVIEHFSKHVNLIYPKFDNWVNEKSSNEGINKYQQRIASNKKLEKEFISKLWEDSVSESIENYKVDELFSLAVLKQFKNKLASIDKEIESFEKSKSLIKKQ